MRLEEFLPDVLRRWWIILLAAVCAGTVGFILASGNPTEYSVSVRLVATAEPADYWLDLYAKNRLATYEPLINNYTFVQDAMAQADLDVDPAVAQRELSVAHTTNQNTLTITVVDTDAQRAADIANAVQFAFIQLNEAQNESLISRVQRDPETFTPRIMLSTVETAGAPTDPIGTGARTTSIAAALLGAIAGAMIIVLLLYKEDVLRSLDDLERHIARPILAVVPDSPSSSRK